MNPITLILLALATWRISNLVANETGPFHVFKRFRVYVRALCIYGPKNGVTFFCNLHAFELLNCEYCNSVWIGTGIGLAYALIGNVISWIALPLALSTSVIFLKRTHERLQA